MARQLRLPRNDALQLFKRMVSNIVARNNDDHSKNFAFYLRDDKWRLTPACDMAFCYKANNLWVEQHWMSANGKRKDHNKKDLIAVGENTTRLPHSEMHQIVDQVIQSVSRWDQLSKEYDVPTRLRNGITKNLLLNDLLR